MSRSWVPWSYSRWCITILENRTANSRAHTALIIQYRSTSSWLFVRASSYSLSTSLLDTRPLLPLLPVGPGQRVVFQVRVRHAGGAAARDPNALVLQPGREELDPFQGRGPLVLALDVVLADDGQLRLDVHQVLLGRVQVFPGL